MPCSVQVIEDSVSTEEKRITTLQLRYPRIIHAEFMTHRVFSRNASSSRAIPTKRLASATADDTFYPTFRKNKPGMQPGEYLTPEEQGKATMIWSVAAAQCLKAAQELSEMGVHKQWSNRLIEWFGYINVVVTSTEWSNFINLRNELDPAGRPFAQDEMYELAQEVKKALHENEPKLLKEDNWHIPYVKHEDMSEIALVLLGEDYHPARSREEYAHRLIKVSAARCARVSFLTTDGKRPTVEEDFALFDKLMSSRHMSPFEHQATPDYRDHNSAWLKPELHGNLTGWIQFRKTILGEDGTTFS